eukprot:185923-Pleurochrysis_carterae.AAC.1
MRLCKALTMPVELRGHSCRELNQSMNRKVPRSALSGCRLTRGQLPRTGCAGAGVERYRLHADVVIVAIASANLAVTLRQQEASRQDACFHCAPCGGRRSTSTMLLSSFAAGVACLRLPCRANSCSCARMPSKSV